MCINIVYKRRNSVVDVEFCVPKIQKLRRLFLSSPIAHQIAVRQIVAVLARLNVSLRYIIIC